MLEMWTGENAKFSLVDNPARYLLKRYKKKWKKHLHFIRLPVSQSGNWIPRVLSQWYCSGHGCGLDQLVIENEKGTKGRLDNVRV